MNVVYYEQEGNSTCSLVVLRMVLGAYGITVSESELVRKVTEDYGKNFKNIWNPTIAKLACEFGIKTKMYALWPLFKRQLLNQALKEYKENPKEMDIRKFENKEDRDRMPEPLPLSYIEMFEAINKGCKVQYGSLTKRRVKSLLSKGYLIQTSVKLQLLYPSRRQGFHSILLYRLKDGKVLYHDPSYGGDLSVELDKLEKATVDVGACIVYKN